MKDISQGEVLVTSKKHLKLLSPPDSAKTAQKDDSSTTIQPMLVSALRPASISVPPAQFFIMKRYAVKKVLEYGL